MCTCCIHALVYIHAFVCLATIAYIHALVCLSQVPNVLKHQPGMVLHASCSGTRPTPLFLCCSPESVMTVVTGIGGRLLASINTNGLKNHDAAMSRDGRFVAAATFTADVKVMVVELGGGDSAWSWLRWRASTIHARVAQSIRACFPTTYA